MLGHIGDRDEQLSRLIVSFRTLIGGLKDDRQAILGSLRGDLRPVGRDLRPPHGHPQAVRQGHQGAADRRRQHRQEQGRARPGAAGAAHQAEKVGRTAIYGSWFNFYLCEFQGRGQAARRAPTSRSRPTRRAPTGVISDEQPFRERNPVIVGAVSLAVSPGLMLRRLPRRRPAAHRRRRHLLRRLQPSPAGSRPTTRCASPASGSARSTRSTSTAAWSVDVQGRRRTRSSAPRPAPRSRSRPCSARCTSPSSRRAAASSRRARPSRSSGPPRRTTSSRRSRAWPAPPSRIDTDQLAGSLTTLADLTRNTPEEFRAALTGVIRLSANVAARTSRSTRCSQPRARSRKVLDERDEDIIALMRGRRHALPGAGGPPRGDPQPARRRPPRCRSELTGAGPATAAPTSSRRWTTWRTSSTCSTRTRTTSTTACG